MKTWLLALAALVGTLSLLVSGCATSGNIKEPIPETMPTQVKETQLEVEQNEMEIATGEQTMEVESERSENEFPVEGILSEGTVHFRFDSSTLSRQAREALDSLAQNLKAQNKDVQIMIQGHTDSVGTDNYNYNLGLDRARVVRAYLHMRHLIPLHRLHIFTYGESRPVADTSTAGNQSKNRRA
ncbi:MAG: OmpA family protein, partial [Deltaproteobacteria bacterium]